jgi:hypothetical protein
MTLDNAGWSLLDRGGRLEILDRDECRRLLGSTNIGRLGYCSDLGPRILPMNYTLVSESVTFRTGLDTEASHQLFDHPIAFEVDQVDEFLQSGWSVLVPCLLSLFTVRAAQARTSRRSPRSTYDPVSLPRRPCDART